MKNFIRAVLDDLKQTKSDKDFIPPIPKAPTDGKTNFLDPPPEAPLPDDLENQNLSSDPEERVEQLDQQAQDDEVRETLES
jgi:type IV secretory pathway VirB10-like protein